MNDAASPSGFGPWNPGLSSQVPERLLPASTLFRPDLAFTSAAQARELHDFTGLPLAELATPRPHRLALHEVLIRVTADLSVPDGERVEDLGINFRRMVRALLARCIEPRADAIDACYANVRAQVDAQVHELLEPDASPRQAPSATARRGGLLARWRRHDRAMAAPAVAIDSTERLRTWQVLAQTSNDEVARAAARALARVVGALQVRHGEAYGGSELIAKLAVDLACNQLCADAIGRLIEPWLVEGAKAEGYPSLPAQEHPFVMNTKGASASGKSTIRLLQRDLAGAIGVDWSQFALISPDIWRKQLIDYAALGDDYKYGGALSGDEIAIVDHKLDRYMAAKARRGAMTHLLIDRFRFDSFAPNSEEAGSNLLTRFGQIVYLFFMLTPPESLVERAWNRGLEVGRFKAIDDTLAHAVEAYSGMPELFFTWVRRMDKRVHFEFLDNTVPLGERPLTAAFGSNAILNVLDVRRLIDVRRYQRIDVNAREPAQIFPDPEQLAAERNLSFLRDCTVRFHEMNFAEQSSGRIYLQLRDGRPAWVDSEALERAVRDADTHAGLRAIAADAFEFPTPESTEPRWLRDVVDALPVHTLGRWGDARQPR